jgi:hypothetical protein
VITRKLHCVHDVKAATLAITLCVLDDIERPRTLQSSSDGVVAFETHTQARPTVRGWRSLAKRTIALGSHCTSDIARSAALAAFAEPDVGGVVVEVGPFRHMFKRLDGGCWVRHESNRMAAGDPQLHERPQC